MTDPIIPPSTLEVIRDSTFRRLGPYRWVKASRVGDPTRHVLVMAIGIQKSE